MTWRKSLRPASFRGVRFHVHDRTLESGRAIHNHEFPKRDTNYPEDMGKKTRSFQVDAYVIGDDYMGRRDQLFAACERIGPGSYVDHWGRSQQVVCESVSLKETSEEGRMCRISLKFLEAGGGAMPMGIAAAGANLVGAALGLKAAGIMSFARFGIVGQALPGLSLAAGVSLGGVSISAGLSVPGLPAAITARVAGSVLAARTLTSFSASAFKR